MKRFICVITVAIVFGACKKEYKKPVDYAVISGTIANTSGDFKLMSSDKSFTHDIELAEDGTFSDTLKVDPGIYIFYNDKNITQIFIEKGDNINIDADANDFAKTLSFSGKGVEKSNYLMVKHVTEKELKGEGASFYKLEEDAFKEKANEIKTTLEKKLNNFQGLSEDWKTKEKRNLNYDYLRTLSQYERFHSHFANKPEFKASEGFLSEMDDISYNNEEDFMFSLPYQRIVTGHYMQIAQDHMAMDSLPYDMAILKTYAKIPNETIKNKLLFLYSQNSITKTNDVEGYYREYMAASTNKENNIKITEIYNQLKTVSKGKPSPKFVNYENYAGGTTSLDDLKGKYVYIDMWATWCGPCIKEIPFLKELEKTYHDKNIEFVSVSIDKQSNHNKWKEMIANKDLGGVQLLADNDWESHFVQDYFIKAIPRFILLDPNGDIIDSNAPRPSDPKLIELFDNLNI